MIAFFFTHCIIYLWSSRSLLHVYACDIRSDDDDVSSFHFNIVFTSFNVYNFSFLINVFSLSYHFDGNISSHRIVSHCFICSAFPVLIRKLHLWLSIQLYKQIIIRNPYVRYCHTSEKYQRYMHNFIRNTPYTEGCSILIIWLKIVRLPKLANLILSFFLAPPAEWQCCFLCRFVRCRRRRQLFTSKLDFSNTVC